MSFFKKLFGGGSPAAPAAPKPGPSIEHSGFTITAAPYQEGSQFQTAGTITKVVDGVEKSHRFVRADRFDSCEAAEEMALRKGKQIVDEQGEKCLS